MHKVTDSPFPPMHPAKGDIWCEHLSSGEKVRWEWDGKVWKYHSDTLETHERREEA